MRSSQKMNSVRSPVLGPKRLNLADKPPPSVSQRSSIGSFQDIVVLPNFIRFSEIIRSKNNRHIGSKNKCSSNDMFSDLLIQARKPGDFTLSFHHITTKSSSIFESQSSFEIKSKYLKSTSHSEKTNRLSVLSAQSIPFDFKSKKGGDAAPEIGEHQSDNGSVSGFEDFQFSQSQFSLKDI